MNKLNEMMRSGDMVVSGWSGMQDPMYLDLLASTGFDAITLDMQHGMQTENSVIRGIAALAPKGKPVVVRVPVGRFDFVSRALDAGANAIIAPMINTREQAEELVSYGKYVPIGDRSFGPTQAAHVHGMTGIDYVTTANKNTVLLAMIETQEAADNMEAIADVDGIDGLFCGPGDLSVSVRNNIVPDAYGPDTIEIVKKIAQTAKDRDKVSATWVASVEHMELVNELGFNFAALGNELNYLSKGVDTQLGQMSFRK